MRVLAEPSELIAWVAARFGTVELVADHSWPHGEARVVVFVTASGNDKIVVKSFRNEVHFERELAGCRYASPILGDAAPHLLASDEVHHLLAFTHLPGVLAQLEHDHTPETHFRAAQLLRRLHDAQPPELDADLPTRMRISFERYVARCDGLVTTPELSAVRGLLERIEAMPIPTVCCHGDFSPRNWLVDGGVIRVIDFARFQRDHWTMDCLLLSRRYWSAHPELRDAFFAGYGRAIDEADDPYFRAALGRWAIGTIVWAHEHADPPFEQLGRDALTDLLSSRS